MTRTKIESKLERQFLTAMIVSKPFLAGVSLDCDVSLLKTKYVRQIAKWCLDHFKSYGTAPGRSIIEIYQQWVETEKPADDEAEAVSDFLESMSQEYERGSEINVPFLLESVSTHLTLARVERLKDFIEGGLQTNQKEEVLNAINKFRTVNLNDRVGYQPTKDKKAVKKTFAIPPENVIEFPDTAGAFFNQVLVRDALIGIQAPEKTGKTWWLIEMMIRALHNRRRVAMFQCGDLSETQVNKRLYVRMAAVPLWESQCKSVKWPEKLEIVKGSDGWTPQVSLKEMTFNAPICERTAKRAMKSFSRKYGLSPDHTYAMNSVHNMSSINVRGIDLVLERWKYELEYVPDVILIDYADILAPEDPKKEYRHQVNDTWKALRLLSQKWNACVITATQAAASSYGAKTQSMKNYSEDKRKYAHVTGMLGLNQTYEEKKLGIMRLNWIVLRETEFYTDRCLWVAQCLPLGQAFVKGTFG